MTDENKVVMAHDLRRPETGVPASAGMTGRLEGGDLGLEAQGTSNHGQDGRGTSKKLGLESQGTSGTKKALKQTFDCTVCGYRHEEMLFMTNPAKPIAQFNRECPECAQKGGMVQLFETREWVDKAGSGPESSES